MKEIQEYALNWFSTQQPLAVPRGGELLGVRVQSGRLIVSALVDPLEPMVKRIIHVLGVSSQLETEDKTVKYLGHFQQFDDWVAHVFDGGEIPKQEQKG